MCIVSSPTSGLVHSIKLVGGHIRGGCVRCWRIVVYSTPVGGNNAATSLQPRKT